MSAKETELPSSNAAGIKQENSSDNTHKPASVPEKKQELVSVSADELFAQLERLGAEEKEKLFVRLGLNTKGKREVKSEPAAGDVNNMDPYMEVFLDQVNTGSGYPTASHQKNSSVGYHPDEDRSGMSYRFNECPKLPLFSGIKEKDSSFGRWRFEVQSLQKMYAESSVLSAVHRSLKSPAADVVIHMPDASVQEITTKLQTLYGTVMSGDALLTKIYSEPQGPSEDITQWATRLEDLCYSAADKDAIDKQSVKKMLPSRFWAGLRNPDIKNALRADKEKSFEELVLQARQLEEEFGVNVRKEKKAGIQHQQHGKQQQGNEIEGATQMSQLLKKMDDLMNTFKQNPKSASKPQQKSSEDKDEAKQESTEHKKRRVTCHNCNEEGHLSFSCRKGSDITCYRCKKTGHIARGCRNALNC